MLQILVKVINMKSLIANRFCYLNHFLEDS